MTLEAQPKLDPNCWLTSFRVRVWGRKHTFSLEGKGGPGPCVFFFVCVFRAEEMG